MNCVICDMWARLPYQARYTTPVEVPRVEVILVTGYWLKSKQEGVPRLCERHALLLEAHDQSPLPEPQAPGLAAQALAAPPAEELAPAPAVENVGSPEPIACPFCGKMSKPGELHACS
jgi:hypothetical protein